jgi:Na+/melibiose symporter-like transporter
VSRYAALIASIVALALFLPFWLLGVIGFAADVTGGTLTIEGLTLFVVTLPVVGLPGLYVAFFLKGCLDRSFSDHRDA